MRADAATTVIAARTGHSDRDSPSLNEKAEDSKIEKTISPQPVIINSEDEVFEWREVRRGKLV